MKMLRIVTLALMVCFSYLSNAQIGTTLVQKKDTVFVSLEQTMVYAEMGMLKVPENRHNEASRLITIKYVRLKSSSNNPAAPLIYLEGGSVPCTKQAENPRTLSTWLPYLAVSDVILVDQRGTADRELQWIWNGPYPENFLVSEKVAGEHWKTMATLALQAFKEKGIDVRGYSVEENAQDIEALRKELNIDKYSILGFSFGTHLGLTLIKLYEDRIENAVLAGVDGLDHSFNYPSDLDVQIKRIAKLAADDKTINGKMPDLIALLRRVMDKLEKEPMEMEIRNPLTGQPMNVKVGPFGLALVLRLDIDDATDIPVIPRLLYSVDQGDVSILKWFVQKRVVLAFAIPANGLTQGIASGASKDRWTRIEKEIKESVFKNVVNFPFYDVKEVWPEVKPEIDFTAHLKSKVRTLFISGDLDCRTPPSQANEIKKGFSNSISLVVKNAGHEQILTNHEIRKIIPIFLSGKDISYLDTSKEALTFIPLVGVNNTVMHPAVKN